jgi:DUF4097 and DUF4098 domain-containing protein YvlB
MKTKTTLFGLFLIAAAGCLLAAEDALSDRTVVPFSDPGKPGLVKIDMINGGVTIKGYEGKDVIIDAKARGQVLGDKDASKHGMHKLQAPGRSGLDVEEKNNIMAIETESWKETVALTVQVPVNTSLHITCVNGGVIVIDNVAGEIQAENVNGAIKLTRISGSVVAETTNGGITVAFAKLNPAKPMSFVTLNGDVDVTLPADAKANVRLKLGNNGDIYSDFEVSSKTTAEKTVEDKRKEGGHYRISIDQAITGAINGGGVLLKLEAFNGDVLLRKTK